MRAEAEIKLNGQDVLISGSVIAYFDGEVSLAFSVDTEWIEVSFLLKAVEAKMARRRGPAAHAEGARRI